MFFSLSRRSSAVALGAVGLFAGARSYTTKAVSCESISKHQKESTLLLASRKTLGSGSGPKIVFIHGLNSAKDTWYETMELLHDYECVAFDLRGHGQSPSGHEDDFTIDQLVEDIRFSLCGTKPFVLVGHSMGGKVVMNYAARYPKDIHRLVIEDMDCRARKYMDEPKLTERRNFSRLHSSWESLHEKLLEFGFSPERIEGWRQGRIFQREDGSWWSSINPLAEYYAWHEVLCRDDLPTLEKLSSLGVPTLLLAADAANGSVIGRGVPGGLEDMKRTFPSMEVVEFPGAFHSVHYADRPRYVEELRNFIERT